MTYGPMVYQVQEVIVSSSSSENQKGGQFFVSRGQIFRATPEDFFLSNLRRQTTFPKRALQEVWVWLSLEPTKRWAERRQDSICRPGEEEAQLGNVLKAGGITLPGQLLTMIHEVLSLLPWVCES